MATCAFKRNMVVGYGLQFSHGATVGRRAARGAVTVSIHAEQTKYA